MYAYSRIEYEYDLMNEMIETEMHKIRKRATEKLSSLFVHRQVIQENTDVMLTIAYGYFDSYKPSENIAKSLDLCKLDFLAIVEDFEAFKEEYLKNEEK
jgi:ubiquinone/menaquinone biosynthesis C-methylase UbiE